MKLASWGELTPAFVPLYAAWRIATRHCRTPASTQLTSRPRAARLSSTSSVSGAVAAWAGVATRPHRLHVTEFDTSQD